MIMKMQLITQLNLINFDYKIFILMIIINKLI